MSQAPTNHQKAGYIAIIGRPNAGKSALINYLLNEKINMVSHKQNATRKRSLSIINRGDHQMIFVDTPGLHKKEKLLNQFMLQEALKALKDCDIVLFLSPINDGLEHYKEFLRLSNGKKHIVILTKKDRFTREKIMAKLSEFAPYQDRFEAIIPMSTHHAKDADQLFNVIAKQLPEHPFFFDEELLTTQTTREICANLILEAIFEKISDEIPYESDVKVLQFKEKDKITFIEALIVVEKKSQKMVFVGEGGGHIRRIGQVARGKIEHFLGEKVFLKLFVSVEKGWSKDKENLEKKGYYFDES